VEHNLSEKSVTKTPGIPNPNHQTTEKIGCWYVAGRIGHILTILKRYWDPVNVEKWICQSSIWKRCGKGSLSDLQHECMFTTNQNTAWSIIWEVGTLKKSIGTVGLCPVSASAIPFNCLVDRNCQPTHDHNISWLRLTAWYPPWHGARAEMIEMSGSNQAILRWFLTEAGSTGCVMDLYGALKLRAKRQMTTFMQNISKHHDIFAQNLSHQKKSANKSMSTSMSF